MLDRVEKTMGEWREALASLRTSPVVPDVKLVEPGLLLALKNYTADLRLR